MSAFRLLLVANPGPGHVGAHLAEAAEACGFAVRVCDTREAFESNAALRVVAWKVGGHRPPRLGVFSKRVEHSGEEFVPDLVLTTGMAPLDREVLDRLAHRGVRVANFSTDDPWNPVHRAPWFLDGLAAYGTIFTPRERNVEDFVRAGCEDVRYLPFAYAPSVHHRWNGAGALPPDEDCDALFVGGADSRRVPMMAALGRAGLRLHLYGSYWARYPETRSWERGMVAPEAVPRLVAGARVAPCLVRRDNRDGHCMRTFELAAMGACIVAEDTKDHRQLFGRDGDAVRYFATEDDLVGAVRDLLPDADRRAAMRERVHGLMTTDHTYEARLRTIVAAVAPAA